MLGGLHIETDIFSMLSVTDIQGGMIILTLLPADHFCGSGGQLLGPGQDSISNELFKNDILIYR